MRAVVQRVKSASVSVDNQVLENWERITGFPWGRSDDDEKDIEYLVGKC